MAPGPAALVVSVELVVPLEVELLGAVGKAAQVVPPSLEYCQVMVGAGVPLATALKLAVLPETMLSLDGLVPTVAGT